MPGKAKFLKYLKRDTEAKYYFSIPRSALVASVSDRITESKRRKAETKKRFKAELARLRSSWEEHIAELASHYSLPSPEAAAFLVNVQLKCM